MGNVTSPQDQSAHLRVLSLLLCEVFVLSKKKFLIRLNRCLFKMRKRVQKRDIFQGFCFCFCFFPPLLEISLTTECNEINLSRWTWCMVGRRMKRLKLRVEA